MQKVFMDSVDRNRNVNVNDLSKNARIWFDFDKDNHINENKSEGLENISYQDIIKKCKGATPSEILGILSSGKPGISELQVVEKIVENFDLAEEVINFLLVYVIGQLEEFPSYKYFDKVASEWRRKNVDTVEKAIDVIKSREKRMSTRHQKSEKGRLPNDIESDWLDDYINKL
jgi:replication initiation and membrane attachment protein